MIKTFVAHTVEADDAQIALQEIRDGLNIESNLLKNSIGIIACHYEFVMTGIAKAVCDALPFDVVGAIASPVSSGEQSDALLMTIMVITSDDAEFISVLTPSLMDDPKKAISESYAASQKGRPKLILTYAPFIAQNSGDDYVNILSEVSDNAPCFGTLAVDDTADFTSCFMFYNGEHYSDKMGMVLMYGNINPKFYMANVSPEKIMERSAIVTKSQGHIVMEINGRSVDDYFTDLGLAKASESQYALAFPFLVDYKDGTPKVSKIYINRTPERYALFASAIPEGSAMHISSFDKDDTFVTTGGIMDEIINDAGSANGLLIYSCIARGMAVGGDMLDEMRLISDKWQQRLPMLVAYSGGEMCPTVVTADRVVNRFHNSAIIACLF